jgi:uncharacterized iron-regulated membrane protein
MICLHPKKEMSAWQRWLHHPESFGGRRIIFQVHLVLGTVASLYILLMSISGTMIVYRNGLEELRKSNVTRVVEWLVDLHDNLLLGMAGRRVNGVGAISLTLLCVTGAVLWWPGITHWRRSLTVNWRSSFARINWDLHSALGFWCFLFVTMWGISGAYFSFPQVFNEVGDFILLWLSNLHFGRLGWFAEALWTLLGLVPAVLSFTGVFLCCRRMIYKLPTGPPGPTRNSELD